MSSVEATKDADKGTWRKKFVTRLEKIVNDEQRNESRGNSEYDKSNDSAVSDTEESDIEESDMEVIDAGQNSKEIDDLSQEFETNFSDDVIREKIKNSLDIGQFTWLEEVLRKKTWNPIPEFTQYINQFTEIRQFTMVPLIKAVEMSSLSMPAAQMPPAMIPGMAPRPGLSPVMGSMPPADIEEEDIFKYRQ
ncbi:hypothetical protein RhiirA4_539624 [Rhizophagus irregularis]|uniref:Uncharacterized protein n=1 Tax=Rhizophagus irregularis TaxID=588596 RepID=A0A2I1G4H8_9GLOM|nr:hypothetical protein RhiirA4_539624 [Rhizophagus irregularis]